MREFSERFSPGANSLPESRAPHFGHSVMPYSAFSVVRKAVRAMFGRAPGHAWVEPETGDLPRGPPQPKHSSKKYRARDAWCGRPARHFAEKRAPPPRRIPTPAHVRAPAGTRVGGTRGEGSGPGTAGVSGSHGKNLGRRARGVWKCRSFSINYTSNVLLNLSYNLLFLPAKKSPRSRHGCKWWNATFRGIK